MINNIFLININLQNNNFLRKKNHSCLIFFSVKPYSFFFVPYSFLLFFGSLPKVKLFSSNSQSKSRIRV